MLCYRSVLFLMVGSLYCTVRVSLPTVSSLCKHTAIASRYFNFYLFICGAKKERERDRMVHLLVLSPPVCNLWGLTRAEVRSRELYWNLTYGWREVSYWSHHLRNEKQKLCSFLSLAARLHYLLTLISFSSSNPIRISFSQPGLESSCNDSHSTHNHYIVGSVPHTQPALNGTGIIISVWTLSSLALSGSSSLPKP